MTGRIVFNSTETAINGTNTYHLNMPQRISGVYYLELISNTETNRTKFIIQK
jgi:hypothetical protein